MKELVIFYLLISAGHLLPLTIFTAALVCDLQIPYLPNTRDDMLPSSRRVWFDRLRGLAIRDFLKEWAPVALLIQLTMVVVISVAISYDYPLSFVPKIDLTPGVMLDLSTFALITTFIQMIPILFLALVVLKIWQIMPYDMINRSINSAIIEYYDVETDTHTTVRLSRSKTAERTIIYANCTDDRRTGVTNFIFVRRRNARTECYVYNNRTLERITPTPVTVADLESLFSPSHD